MDFLVPKDLPFTATLKSASVRFGLLEKWSTKMKRRRRHQKFLFAEPKTTPLECGSMEHKSKQCVHSAL